MTQGSREKTLPAKIWDVLYPAAAALLCMLIASFAVITAAGLITGRQGAGSRELMEAVPGLPLWVSAVFYGLILITQRKQYALDALRFDGPERRWRAGKIAAACLLAVAAGHLLSTGIEISGFAELFPGYTEQSALAFEGQNPVLLTAVTVILGPPAEEMIFRGMTYRRARSYLGPVRGALISAALFGLYHGNMVQFLYAFLMGLLFAAFCEKSGNIRTSTAAHAAANLWAVFCTPLMTFLSGASPAAVPAAAAAEAVTVCVCGWILFRKRRPASPD